MRPCIEHPYHCTHGQSTRSQTAPFVRWQQQGKLVAGLRKKSNIPACPNYLTDHVRSVAGPMSTLPLTTDRFIYNEADSEAVCVQDFVCGFCQNIIDEPIELPCKHSTCCVCILETLKQNVNTFPCPKCQRELQLTISSFQEPPPVAISVYGSW